MHVISLLAKRRCKASSRPTSLFGSGRLFSFSSNPNSSNAAQRIERHCLLFFSTLCSPICKNLILSLCIDSRALFTWLCNSTKSSLEGEVRSALSLSSTGEVASAGLKFCIFASIVFKVSSEITNLATSRQI